jgi:tetratricopeptide (TPR) repeat protein
MAEQEELPDAGEAETASSAQEEQSDAEEVATAAAPAKPATPPRVLSVFIVALAALAPAAIIYVTMSNQATIQQRAVMAEFHQSMAGIESKLASLQMVEKDARTVIAGSMEPVTYLSLLSEGNLQFQQGDFQAAARSYQAAISMDTDGTMGDEAHYRLALCLLKQEARDPALQEFLTIVRSHPGSGFFGRCCTGAARILMERGQFAQARRFLYMAIGARERLKGDDCSALEEAQFAMAECFEAEAASIEASRSVEFRAPDNQRMEAIQ